MARRQNQKALYEAIRQGQAKIAEGLKTGQMRSDRKRFMRNEGPGSIYPAAELQADEETEYDSGSSMPSKATWIGVAVAAQIVILVLGVWLGSAYFGARNEEPTIIAENTTQKVFEEEDYTPAAKQDIVRYDSGPVAAPVENKPAAKPVVIEKKTEPTAVPEVVASTGNNVIVIQGIQESRKDMLLPLKEYFDKKGVQTEVIVRNGEGLLVTKAGFAVNPESRGTPGYEVMLQIKKLGMTYPQETGDTKFGIKPFQDSYGLLK